MLVEIKALNIDNQGYKRVISLNTMYINSDSVVSIVDYEGVNSFLLREQSRYSGEKFSLIKINEGGRVQDIIAFGPANEIFSCFNSSKKGKQLLND